MTEKIDFGVLLDHLAENHAQPAHRFQDWQILPVSGGANNLIYRATRAATDVAVKFTLRDARHRAEREHTALTALRQLGLRFAPAPLWLETARYSHPVVVQSWLTGEVLKTPLQTEEVWEQLIQLYTELHKVTTARTQLPLRTAILAATSLAEAKQLVFKQADFIPQRARPPELQALLRALALAPIPNGNAERVLCHVDANLSNFIVRSGELYAVDWEGSGWSSAAFELANLMTHPAYLNVPGSRWEWVITRYAEHSEDALIAEHIMAYYPFLVMFWVARFARMLYEVPLGLDSRLVRRPATWRADIENKYRHYLALADTLF